MKTLAIALVAACGAAAPGQALAQTGNQWNEPRLPVPMGAGGRIVAAGPDEVYYAPGGLSTELHRYTISTGAWDNRAPLPQSLAGVPGVIKSAALAHRPGTTLLYFAIGYYSSGTPVTYAFYEFNAGTNAWRTLAPIPFSFTGLGSLSMAATVSKVYLHSSRPGSTDKGFYEYLPAPGAPGAWTVRSDPPYPVVESHHPWDGFTSLCYPGTGDFLYGPCSRTSLIWRYSITGNSWTPVSNSAGIAGDLFIAGPVDAQNPDGSLYGVTSSWISNGSDPIPSANFHRYNIADDERTVLTRLPAMGTLSGGSGRFHAAYPYAGDRIYMVRGFGTDFWSYSIPNNRFETERDLAPEYFEIGCAMTSAGEDDFYVLRGYAGGSAHAGFYRYRVSENQWKAMAGFPPAAKRGASLAWIDGDEIYALEGDSPYLWSYSIGADAWTKLQQPLPVLCSDGAQIVHAGGGRLFVLPGWAASAVYASDSGSSWTAHALPDGEVFGPGCRICHPGSGDLLYVLVGGGTIFRGLSISTGSWTLLTPAPEPVDTGSALGLPGRGRRLYAVLGTRSTFWSYRPSDDTWSSRADAPGMTGRGAAMAGDGSNLYVLPGGWSRVLLRYTPNLVPFVDALSQFRRDGATPLDPAIATHEGRIVLKAGVDDDNVRPLRLQIEVRPAGESFSGMPTDESSLVDPLSISEVAITLNGLAAPADYHWQAQVVNSLGLSSGWTSFGTDPETDPSEVDFKTRPDELPTLATPAAQVNPVTQASIAPGGQLLLSEGGILFQAIVDDVDGDLARMEVEVKTVGTVFVDTATFTSPMVRGGDLAGAYMPFELGEFHWQFRLVDSIGFATAWTPFGGNGEEATDFRLQFGGSQGKSGCSQSATALPFRAWTPAVVLLLIFRRRFAGALALAAALSMTAAAHAQSAPKEWSDPLAIPVPSTFGGVIATDPDTLYVGSNGNGGYIYRYTVSTNTWTRRAGPGGYTNNTFVVLPGYIFTMWSRYDIAKDEWKDGYGGPAYWPMNPGQGMTIVAANGGIFAYGGRGALSDGTPVGVSFWRYEPTGLSGGMLGSWTRLADLPFAVGSGARMVYPGAGDFIYGTRGMLLGIANLEFWRYSLSEGTWTRLAADLPAADATGPMCAVADGPADFYIYKTGFHRYSTRIGAWEAPPEPPPGGIGGGLTAIGDIIYAARGIDTTDLWRYSHSQRRFLFERPQVPAVLNAGSALVGAGNGDIYALRGGGTTDFFRYSGGQWTPDIPTPAPVGSGASMTFHGGSIYATAGGGSKALWVYTPGGGWAALVESPVTGTSLVHGGGDLIFLASDVSGVLQRYSVSGASWIAPSSGAPTLPYYWTLAYPGSGDLIYAQVYVNSLSKPFWSYSQSHDEWNVRADGNSTFDPADPPLRLGPVACGADNVLYFMPASGSNQFWAYTVPNDTWTLLKNMPGTPGAGAGIAWPGQGQYLYSTQGGGTAVMRSYWIPPNNRPDDPTGLAQFLPGDQTPIAPGATALPTSVTLTATATDPDSDPVRLEVEARPVDDAFLDTGFTSGLTSSGETVPVTVENLVRGTRYHWQARTLDADGKSSGWVSFGAMPENPGETDFRVRPNTAPAASAVGQFLALDGTPLPVGHVLVNSDPTIRFDATLTDPEGDDGVIEIEVIRTDEDYAGVPMVISVPVASGGVARAYVALDLGSYQWKRRTVDALGAAGPWTSFGGNADGAADFALETLNPVAFQPPVLPSPEGGGCLGSAGAGPAGALLLLAAGLLIGFRLR